MSIEASISLICKLVDGGPGLCAGCKKNNMDISVIYYNNRDSQISLCNECAAGKWYHTEQEFMTLICNEIAANRVICTVCDQIVENASYSSFTKASTNSIKHKVNINVATCSNKCHDVYCGIAVVNSLTMADALPIITNKRDGCFACKKESAKLMKCAKCSYAQYCSRECQVIHWPKHKEICVNVSRMSSVSVNKEKIASLVSFIRNNRKNLNKSNLSMEEIDDLAELVAELDPNMPETALDIVKISNALKDRLTHRPLNEHAPSPLKA